MLDAFIHFTKNQFGKNWINKKCLVAVSGGLDSIVLCELLYQLSQQQKINWKIAHCNFQLRGDESDGDELFVRNLAKKYKVEIFVKKFDTEKEAKKQQISIQIAARKLRYDWFEELLQINHFDYLLTAHHADDSFETTIYNLVKGTGIAGLRGIKPQQGNVIRPLLFATRQQIADFASTHHLTWREDSSNASDKYSRNLIRHQVIPVLKTINPTLSETFANTAERIAATERILQKVVNDFEQKAITINENGIKEIDIKIIQQENEKLLILYEILKKHDFTYSQTKEVINILTTSSGKQVISVSTILLKDRDKLLIYPNKLAENVVATTKEYSIKEGDALVVTPNFTLKINQNSIKEKNSITPSKNMALLDKSKLKFPLLLRTWQAGDKFCPTGMKGRQKKISDFLINAKVPLLEKEKIYVLCSNTGEIAWIVGWRVDERFAADFPTNYPSTDNSPTKDIICFEMIASSVSKMS